MNNILNKAIITKVDNVTRVDFIKAKEQVKYNPDELEILKAELEKWQNENNRLKKQLRIIKTLSKHKITDIEDIYKIEVEKDAKLLSANLAEIIFLNFLPDKTLLKCSWDYQKVIDDFNNEFEYTQKAIRTFENIINKYDLKIQVLDHNDNIINSISLGLATPNDVRKASVGTKQTLKWIDVDETHKKEVKELLKSTAPEILQKLEDDDNPNEIISHFIGIKLTKTESRILKTLRALVDRAFKLKEIQSYSHKVRIIRSDFYKEYGLKPRASGGYEDNQTKKIREILFSETSNLTKRIFFNNSRNKTVLVTAFVLRVKDKGNYFEVTLDDIIFVKDGADRYSYYYEDLQGLNRLIELMPNSDIAFDIHGYLEYSLRGNVQPFGITKIINVSDSLLKRYKKEKKRTEYRIEEVLDNMVKAKTLISKWQKVIGKNETQYLLTNIRQKEISNTTKKAKKKKKYNQ